MAFNFEDELGGFDDAALMGILGTAPTVAPAPSPVFSAPAPSPSVVGAPMAAPAPSPFVSPLNQGVSQDQSFDDLMSYVMSGQPTMKAVSAPAPISSSVPAYSPAPSPVYTQAPAAFPAPTTAAAPSPMNLFGMDVTQDQLADLGVSAPAAPAPSPVQAPAPSTAAQAPAPAAKQGYTAYSGEFSPELIKLMPKSGADIGRGAWQFDTQADREREAYEAQYGGNAETGAAGGSGVNAGRPLTEMKEVQDENGNWISQPTNELDKRYGLTDTTGLVHGTQTVPIDKTHYKVTNAFFDPKTGKMVGQPIVGTYEQKQSLSDKLTDIGMALASAAITGGTLGGQLFNVAKAAGTGNTLGALTGALGIAGGAGDVLGADVAGAAKTAKDVIGAGTALQSGDPLRILGAAANVTGSEDLANVAKAANTAAVLGKAAQGDVGAALNLLNMVGPTAFSKLTGGGTEAGAMTGGEADERKGVSEVTDLINNLAFAPTPSPAPAPAPTPAPAPAPSTDTGEDETESEEDKEGTEAAIDALTKGADTAASVSGEDLTKGTSDQTVQDLLDAGLTSEDTDTDSVINELTGNKSSSLSEQAKFLESNVEDADDIDQLLKDYAIDTGQLQGEYSNVGALDKDYTVGDTGKILDAGTNDLADQFLGGNLEEDYVVTDRGTVKSTYTGEEGTFDADGNWVPYTGGTGGVSSTSGTGGKGGTGGGTPTKTTTPTKPTAAKSGLDLNSLMAWMALAGDEEQAQAPQQQLFNLGQRKSAEEIFGLKQPTTLADLLRRRA